MARRLRVHFPGALYYVISRGNQRQKIYKDDPDYQRFETLLGQVVKRHSLTLTAVGRCRWSGSAPGFAKDADVIVK